MSRLKEIRKEFNLSQKELATKLGRKQNTISAIEKETYPMERIMALAIEAILGINAEWLLTGKGDKYKASSVSSSILKGISKKTKEDNFMNRLKEIRKEFNLNQTDLANKIGRKQNNISDIEIEKYPIEKVTALAIEAILGINAEWLLTGNGNKYKKSGVSLPIVSSSTSETISKKEITKIIDDFWRKANSEEKIWLKIQLRKWIYG